MVSGTLPAGWIGHRGTAYCGAMKQPCRTQPRMVNVTLQVAVWGASLRFCWPWRP